jgi:hypothetical protein
LQQLLSIWSPLLLDIQRYSQYPLIQKIKICNEIDRSLLTSR